jgi:hypothetical protein
MVTLPRARTCRFNSYKNRGQGKPSVESGIDHRFNPQLLLSGASYQDMDDRLPTGVYDAGDHDATIRPK